MVETIKDHSIDEITFKNPDNSIIDQLAEGLDLVSIHDSIKDDNTNIIFPICGKRCYNTVMKKIKDNSTITKNGQSKYEKAKSWDNDGNENSKSSIEVLVDWITTEENASKYFGGLDIEGKTSATRKEAYHHHIRDLIKAAKW